MKSISMAAMTGLILGLGASAVVAQEQKPPMGFFVTSVGTGKGGDLGGLEGADAHCQALAEVAIPRALFAEILHLIDGLRPAPLPP